MFLKQLKQFFFFFLIETGKHFKKALGHMPAVKMDGVSQNFMKLKNGNSWLLNYRRV